MFKNLTTAQAAVLHLFESLVASIAITVIVGGIQYLSINGLNIPGLVGVCVSAFLGAVALAYKSIKNSQELPQAILDTTHELKIAPGLLPDIAHLAQQLAPALAQELAKIKLPAPPQPQRQQQAVQQPLQASQSMIQPNYPPGQSTLPGPSYSQQQPGQQQQAYNLATQQMQSVPPFPGQYPGQSG